MWWGSEVLSPVHRKLNPYEQPLQQERMGPGEESFTESVSRISAFEPGPGTNDRPRNYEDQGMTMWSLPVLLFPGDLGILISWPKRFHENQVHIGLGCSSLTNRLATGST